MTAARLLVLEDDESIREALVDGLTLDGYTVEAAEGLARARELCQDGAFDLLILDVILPDGSGLELLRETRDSGSMIPVIMVTARGTEEDRVLGFEHGCDDYVVKPFSLPELRLRLKALLRRSGIASPEPASLDKVIIGKTEVDLEAYRVVRDGVSASLSPKERDMIRLFLEEAGRVIPRSEFLNRVWGYDRFPTTRTVDMHVRKLRQKIEIDADQPKHFITVHGAGYRLDL